MEIELVSELGDEVKAVNGALWKADDEANHGADEVARWVDVDGYRKSINLISSADGAVVGWAAGWISEGVAHLNDLGVIAEHRGRGTGSALLDRFETEARQRQCRRAALRTLDTGPARSFYEKHGWYSEVPLSDWLAGKRYVQMRKDFTATHPSLAELDGWQQAGSVIRKTYEFDDFVDSVQFVNRITEHAERADHHPDIDIRWNKVHVALTTHSAGGLTDKDFALASVIDDVS